MAEQVRFRDYYDKSHHVPPEAQKSVLEVLSHFANGGSVMAAYRDAVRLRLYGKLTVFNSRTNLPVCEIEIHRGFVKDTTLRDFYMNGQKANKYNTEDEYWATFERKILNKDVTFKKGDTDGMQEGQKEA
jgi:hypothetical protein